MKYHTKPEPADLTIINEWETAFQVEIPEDLKNLLLDSNGPVLYTEETGKELQILSVQDAIEYHESYKFDEFCKNAIPISLDGCGNFVVYKLVDGIVEKIYAVSSTNMGWHDAVFLKNTMSEVIEMTECIEEALFS